MRLYTVQFRPANPGDGEVIAFLQRALAEARAGRIVGIAAVFLREPEGYSVDAAGEARRCPVFTRGALPDLQALLTELSKSP